MCTHFVLLSCLFLLCRVKGGWWILFVMDQQGSEYTWQRPGKWEGHRHGARNRYYSEQVEGIDTGARSLSTV